MSLHRYPHSNLYIWTGVIAIVTILTGLLSLAGGIYLKSGFLVTPDIAGGGILILIGAILITGLTEGKTDRGRFVQYGYCGMLLLLIFGLCTLLITSSEAVTVLIEGEQPDLTPLFTSGIIWSAILSAPAYPYLRKILHGCSHGDAV